MGKLHPPWMPLIASLVGVGAVGDPTPLAPLLGVVAAAAAWKFWKWGGDTERPVVANTPPSRAETCAWLMRHLTRLRMGHLAQRVDRAFQKAHRADDAVRTPGTLRRPRDVEARLDAFDLSANNLVVCVQYQGAIEEALWDLERVAASIDRTLSV